MPALGGHDWAGGTVSERDIQVWIIEDNTRLRSTLREIVNECEGMEPRHVFGSFDEALPVLELGEVPDVVLSDLGLPGIDGVEGIERFKARSPSSHLVVLTVHEDDQKIFDALCAGAAGYLLKPATAEKIVGAIRTAFGGGAPMNAFVARKVLDTFSRSARVPDAYGLTARELEILELIAEEQTQKEMAKRLFLSPHTVDTHLRNIYAKLHVRTRAGAIAKALKEGLL